MTTSGRTTRPDEIVKSREREPTEDALRMSPNVFDRFGRSKGEDMHTYLEARVNSATSRRREDLSIVSPINDEINKLRARLKKLVARNTEAALLTITSPFSAKIQQAPLPTGFRMPTMATYEGKTDPQDHLDTFNDQMNLLQVTTLSHYKCFAVTMSGIAKKWVWQIESETVVFWGQLSVMFMCQFQGACKYATSLSRLANIKQGPNKTLKSYIKHFNDELTTIHNP